MSQNRNDDSRTSTTGTSGTTPRTGATNTGTTNTGATRGTTGGTATGGGTGSQMTTTGTTRSGGGAAAVATQEAQGYSERITDAATQAKDYVSDKMSVVGDKLKDLQNTDYREVAENAKQYAKQNPGQALLISAAAGFLLGLLIRGGRR